LISSAALLHPSPFALPVGTIGMKSLTRRYRVDTAAGSGDRCVDQRQTLLDQVLHGAEPLLAVLIQHGAALQGRFN